MSISGTALKLLHIANHAGEHEAKICRDAARLVEELFSECDAKDDQIEALRQERLKLDRRIHNQRKSLRANWEIVEMRRNYMGSPASRAAYARLLRRHKELLSLVHEAGTN